MNLIPRRFRARFEAWATGGASAAWTGCTGNGYHDYDRLPWCDNCGGQVAYLQHLAQDRWEWLSFVIENPHNQFTETDVIEAKRRLWAAEEDVITVMAGGDLTRDHVQGVF